MKKYYGVHFSLQEKVKTHLFLICPNNSGSTFLIKALRISKSTWNLKGEGQYLFGFSGPNATTCLNGLWASKQQWIDLLQDESLYNWEATKKSWYFQAFSKNPNATIFTTKSPPFLLYVNQLNSHFKNAHFIFMVRNPYAVIEGISRRKQKRSREDILSWAAIHIINCFKHQKFNIANYPKSIFFTYEDMCTAPQKVEKVIHNFVPELNDLVLDQKLNVKNIYNDYLRNMNDEQIAKLSKNDFEIINKVFAQQEDVLNYFGYKIISSL